MGSALLSLGASLQVTLAGSVISVPGNARGPAARQLHSDGSWTHLDVIDGPYGDRPSVTIEQIEQIVAQRSGPVDVHLMVGDIPAWIARLPLSLDRITVQISLSEYLTGVAPSWVSAARMLAAEVWVAVDPLAETEIPLADLTLGSPPRGTDGVLVMLVPPGRVGYVMDEQRLEFVQHIGASAGFPVGVDGGVNVTNLERIAALGVTYAVSGRGLFESDTQSELETEAGHP
jgi:pentose-5-phosphate-3-epimerase